MSKTPALEVIPAPWQQVVLVCKKCSKKLDGGFGADGGDTLARMLKSTAREAGRRREVRVIETKCLGLCPKGAVAVLPASRPGVLLSVPAGTDAATVLAAVSVG